MSLRPRQWMNEQPTAEQVAAYEAETQAFVDAHAEEERFARIGEWVVQHEAHPLQHAVDYRAAALAGL